MTYYFSLQLLVFFVPLYSSPSPHQFLHFLPSPPSSFLPFFLHFAFCFPFLLLLPFLPQVWDQTCRCCTAGRSVRVWWGLCPRPEDETVHCGHSLFKLSYCSDDLQPNFKTFLLPPARLAMASLMAMTSRLASFVPSTD